MPGLLDLADAHEQVLVRGKAIDVYGVSTKGLIDLMRRFPALGQILEGASLENVSEFVESGGDMVGALIASGCGTPGNADAERVAVNLPLVAQIDLVEAVFRQTMPDGFGPFVERLKALGLRVKSAVEAVNPPGEAPSAEPSSSAPSSEPKSVAEPPPPARSPRHRNGSAPAPAPASP